MKIFLNPGHAPNGDPDPGAVNHHSGLRECDVALKVANQVAQFLQKVGYDVKILQSDSLGEICRASNNWNADLFVSIHCNASASHNARGSESWYWYGSNNGRFLATAINSETASIVKGIYNRGTKEGNFYVLRNTDAPAVLIELAFIDNDDDADILINAYNDFARAIALGISDFYAGK